MSGWIVRPRPRPLARHRLICVPFAGGSASAFRPWAAALPDDVELCAVQLPGRESRFNEPRLETMAEVVDQVLAPIAQLGDRPLTLFGHSLGALIAFEVQRRLEAGAGRAAELLIASGCGAPDWPRRPPPTHQLPDAELAAAVRRLGGTPPEVLAHQELLAVVLPILRADLAIHDRHRHRPGPPLAASILAVGGTDDPLVDSAALEAWRAHTTGTFDVVRFEGDHFFVQARHREVLALLNRRLGADGPRPPPGA